jgi:carbonic anhydrase
LAGLLTCPVCRRAAATPAAHWAYEGEAGPARWSELAGDYRACGAGHEQSPVDLGGGLRAEVGDVGIEWQPFPLAVINNGHTIQASVAPGSRIVLGGKAYALVQFHFHHPSEHTQDGRSFPMEVHFVHRAQDGGLAVLGVLMAEGAAHPTVATLWDAMPAEEGERHAATLIDARTLLPGKPAFYRYAGSLTTPPCSETVLWTVYAEPIEVSRAQIEAFARLFPNNARPVQALYRRFLLTNF